MFNTREEQFCGHCGDLLPAFGARLGFCQPCARQFRRVIHNEKAERAEPRVERTSTVRNYLHVDEFAKDPLLATILSAIFPGGGQVYNGHLFKALLVFVTSPLVIPWLIGIADAFFSARRHNRKQQFATAQAV